MRIPYWRPCLPVLLAALAAPAAAGPVEDAFAAFIDGLRAQGRSIVERTGPGGWREARTASLEPRADELPLGRDQFVMFVAPGCRACRDAQEDMRKRRMSVEVLDITTSKTAREAFALAGGDALPVLLIGSQRLTGWSPRLFKEAMRRALQDQITRQQGQGA